LLSPVGARGETLSSAVGAGPPARAVRLVLKRIVSRLSPATAVWVVLGALIIVPVGAFLLNAVSPRLFDQGSSWFTLSAFDRTFTGRNLHGFADSLFVSASTAVIALCVSTALAWLTQRTDLPGRRAWNLGMWALLLMPTFLMGDGWEYLLQPAGVLQRLGVPDSFLYHFIFGPGGVILVLSLAGLPFAYFVMSAAVGGLGQELEDAVRVHGGRTKDTIRTVLPVLMPAMLSAVAIVFAESMSDFGVSSTLAYYSHFPMATFGLFSAINTNPTDFGVAATLGILLVASAVIPIWIQSRALKGRSYAVLSGRSRQPTRRRLSPSVKATVTVATVGLFAVGIGIPLFGALVASMLPNFGINGNLFAHGLTLANYGKVFGPDYIGPMILSTKLSALTAIVTVAVAVVMARLITSRRAGRSAKLADFALLGSMALPGIVLAAGYLFAFNLPVASKLGLGLYETMPLLVMGYVATALPSQSRLLVGPMMQIQSSLVDAARTHGSSAIDGWRRAVGPVLSRTLVWAWLYTFAKTLMELPVSQILYPPGHEPISAGIADLLSNYHYDVATAMTVVSAVEMFGVILIVLGAFRLFAPEGWRRMGAISGRSEP
jgi:iron(III) transport system permease protein